MPTCRVLLSAPINATKKRFGNIGDVDLSNPEIRKIVVDALTGKSRGSGIGATLSIGGTVAGANVFANSQSQNGGC